MEKFFAGRHFEDDNDLTEGFDTKLKPLSEQSPETINKTVNEILKNTKEKGLNRILLISSNRIRAIESAEIIKQRLLSEDESVKARIIADDRFAELYHGVPILPEGYVREARVEYLKDAWDAFWNETFDGEGNYRNYNYRFGDPINVNGQVKYPELSGQFKEFGESYKEVCSRYYSGILEFLKNLDRLKETKLNIVLISHSATIAIINKLFEVTRDGKIFEDSFKTGDLMKICWQYHLKDLKNPDYIHSTHGSYRTFSLFGIDLLKVIDILEKEVDYLQNH